MVWHVGGPEHHGAACGTFAGVPRGAFRYVSGEDNIKSYWSSEKNERIFCGTCGSPVFSTNDSMPDLVMPRASLVDQSGTYAAQMTVWAARATVFDTVDADLPSFDYEVPEELKQAVING